MKHQCRGACAVALGLVAAAVTGAPVAATEPPPRPPHCAAADLAGIASGVAASTSVYLFTHPEVDAFFTGLQGRPQEEVSEAVRGFFDAHPREHAELSGIRQPLVDFRARCGLPERNLLEGQ